MLSDWLIQNNQSASQADPKISLDAWTVWISAEDFYSYKYTCSPGSESYRCLDYFTVSPLVVPLLHQLFTCHYPPPPPHTHTQQDTADRVAVITFPGIQNFIPYCKCRIIEWKQSQTAEQYVFFIGLGTCNGIHKTVKKKLSRDTLYVDFTKRQPETYEKWENHLLLLL